MSRFRSTRDVTAAAGGLFLVCWGLVHLGFWSHGALVDSVSAGGPAAAAGLRGGTHAEQFQGQTVTVGGDVIVAVDGRPIASAADLVRIVTNTLRPGQTALFSVVRGSSRRAIAVTLTARSPR